MILGTRVSVWTLEPFTQPCDKFKQSVKEKQINLISEQLQPCVCVYVCVNCVNGLQCVQAGCLRFGCPSSAPPVEVLKQRLVGPKGF